MIKIASVRWKNLLLFGAKGGFVDLSRPGLVAVFGDNGVGKSTIADAICFALTGKPMRPIKLSDMVNARNASGMEVVVEMYVAGRPTIVVRGQKPSVCRLMVGDRETPWEDLAKDKRYDKTMSGVAETTKEIASLVGLGVDAFRTFVFTSTVTPLFLELDSAVQKAVVEDLFGFGLLTERASLVRGQRESFERDAARERGTFDERIAVAARARTRLAKAKEDSARWSADRASRIAAATSKVADLEKVDLEAERLRLADYDAVTREACDLVSRRDVAAAAVVAACRSLNRADESVARLRADLAVDYSGQLSLWDEKEDVEKALANLVSERRQVVVEQDKLMREAEKLLQKLDAISESCPTCERPWPDVDAKRAVRATIEAELAAIETTLVVLAETLNKMDLDTTGFLKRKASIKTIHRSREDLAVAVSKASDAARELDAVLADKTKIEGELAILKDAAVELDAAVDEILAKMEGMPRPKFLDAVAIERAQAELETAKYRLTTTAAEVDPHQAEIAALEADVVDPDPGPLSLATSLVDHARFLEQSLGWKGSPLRAAALSKYLPYLNERIAHYLGRLGMEHSVSFDGDLEPIVRRSGMTFSAGGLSGGQKQRVSMALAWAFRDVYERTTGGINLVGVDERLDTALDGDGGRAAFDVLKEMASVGKTVVLVTHRRDLCDLADRTIEVSIDGEFSKMEEGNG